MSITTEELATLSPTIITEKRWNDWKASFAEQPGCYEIGRTEAEAIGKLHLLHQDILGTIQRKEQS